LEDLGDKRGEVTEHEPPFRLVHPTTEPEKSPEGHAGNVFDMVEIKDDFAGSMLYCIEQFIPNGGAQFFPRHLLFHDRQDQHSRLGVGLHMRLRGLKHMPCSEYCCAGCEVIREQTSNIARLRSPYKKKRALLGSLVRRRVRRRLRQNKIEWCTKMDPLVANWSHHSTGIAAQVRYSCDRVA